MYTVVIADDEQIIHEGIKTTIRSTLPELDVAQVFDDGAMLYDYLGTHQPDILLLDIEMPGSSGLDIARYINEQGHKSYVIIITAHHNFEYAKKAIDYRVDAFLTKPFSSLQLVDALKKAMSYIAQKRSLSTTNRSAYRTLLQTLCADKTDLLSYDDICLCHHTAQLSELNCTEVTFKDDAISALTDPAKSDLIQTLTECTETDSVNQSIFFLGAVNDQITFLLFSKEEPDLSFATETSNIINCYTGSAPQCVISRYPSLSDYRIHQSFIREMDTFFSILTTAGSNQAKKQFTDYVQSLPVGRCRSFARFLTDNHLTGCDDFTGSEADAHSEDRTCADILIGQIDSLISHTLGTHSGNYIVDSARDYIHQNYASSSLSLDATADALSISANYLGRIFKKHTGRNFSEYLQNFRMEQAQLLLKTTHMPTIEVAAAVGYSNPVYFRISFKAHFGMTPTQFRQLQTRKE